MKRLGKQVAVLFCVAAAGCRCEQPKPIGAPRKVASTKVATRERVFLAASDILIAYKGSARAPQHVTRTRDEALQLATKLSRELGSKPSFATFDLTARQHSNAPLAAYGGYLGAWTRGTMPPEIERAVEKLRMDEVSTPIETPEGYHVLIRRIAVLAGARILISYDGAQGAPAKITRDYQTAKALAEKLSARLQAKPGEFAGVAVSTSDDAATARSGGVMGKWARGQHSRLVEEAFDGLDLGQVSAPVSSPQGFWILRRDDPSGR
jgi:hypothetical protein